MKGKLFPDFTSNIVFDNGSILEALNIALFSDFMFFLLTIILNLHATHEVTGNMSYNIIYLQ